MGLWDLISSVADNLPIISGIKDIYNAIISPPATEQPRTKIAQITPQQIQKAQEWDKQVKQSYVQQQQAGLQAILSASPAFSGLPKQIQQQVINKIKTPQDLNDLIQRDPMLAKQWQELPQDLKSLALTKIFGEPSLQEPYFEPVTPGVVGTVTRSLPAYTSALLGSLVGEMGKQSYEATTQQQAPWYLAPLIDFVAGTLPSVAKILPKTIKSAPVKEVEETGGLRNQILQRLSTQEKTETPVSQIEEIPPPEKIQTPVPSTPQVEEAPLSEKIQTSIPQEVSSVERIQTTVPAVSQTEKVAPQIKEISPPEEATPGLLDRINTLRNSVTLSENARNVLNRAEQLLKEGKEDVAQRWVSKIEAQYPQQQETLNLLKQIEESTPEDIKKILEDPNIQRYYTFNPVLGVWQGLRKLDEVLYNKVTSQIEDTKIDKFIRTFADIEGLPTFSRKVKDAFLTQTYYPALGRLAQMDTVAERLSSQAKQVSDQIGADLVVRYLEEPEARRVIEEIAPPDMTNALQNIRQMIDQYSQELMDRGKLLPSQFQKWNDRYLSRIYLNIEDTTPETTRKLKEIEIRKGRQIESIIRDLTPEERAQLGYVDQPDLLVSHTLGKQAWNIVLDDVYRELINTPEVLPDEARQFLVTLPENLRAGKLPEIMSPVYAKNKIIPWLKDAGYDTAEFERYVNEQLGKLQQYTPPEGFYTLPQDRVGVLAGLPVNKDVYNLTQGLVKFAYPEELTSKADKIASGLLASFKFLKVPMNPASYVRNMLSNVFQWSLSGANPADFPVYLYKAIRSIAQKDDLYNEALAGGLLNKNFASEELLKVFNAVKPQRFTALNSILEKIGNAYGSVDDLWKLARYIYAQEVEKQNPADAILTAQRAHFDYSLTYPIIRAMREPTLEGNVVAKLFGNFFPTYLQKVAGLMYDSAIKRPATTLGIVSLPYIIKNSIENNMQEKYGQDYQLAKNALPSYLNSPANTVIMDDDGNIHVVNLSYIIPWENYTDALSDLASAVKEGMTKGWKFGGEENFAQFLNDIGITGNPLVGTLAYMKTGKDPFTQREMSPEEYFRNLVTPPFVSSAVNAQQSQTRNPIASVFGYPVFTYKRERWEKMLRGKINNIKEEIGKEVGAVKSQYRRGVIDEDTAKEQIQKLMQLRRELIQDLVNGD